MLGKVHIVESFLGTIGSLRSCLGLKQTISQAQAVMAHTLLDEAVAELVVEIADW